MARPKDLTLRLLISAKNTAGRVVQRVSDQVNTAVKTTLKWVSALGTLAGAWATFRGIGVAADIESIRSSVQAVTKDTGDFQEQWAMLNELADDPTLPLTIQQVAEAFLNLKNFGLDASREAILAYGNVAAGFRVQGKSLDDFVQAVADATKFQFDRLAEFGVGFRQEGEEVVFTFQGVETRVAKSAKAIEGYFQSMGRTQFAGRLAAEASTFQGLMASIGEAIENAQRSIASAGLFQAVKKEAGLALENLREWQTSGVLDDIGKALAEAFKAGVAAVKELVGQIDGKELAQGIRDFASSAGEALRSFRANVETVGSVTRGVIDGLTAAWYALQTGPQWAASIAAGALALIVEGYARATEQLAEFGVVEEETARKARAAADNMAQTFQQIVDKSEASWEKTKTSIFGIAEEIGLFVDETKDKLGSLSDIKVELDVDLARAEAAVKSAEERFAQAQTALDNLVASGANVSVIEAAMREVEGASDDLRNKVIALDAVRANVKIDADDKASPKLDEVDRKANALNGKRVVTKIEVDGVTTYRNAFAAGENETVKFTKASKDASQQTKETGKDTEETGKKQHWATQIVGMSVTEYIKHKKASRQAADAQREQADAAEQSAESTDKAARTVSGFSGLGAAMAQHLRVLRDELYAISAGAVAAFNAGLTILSGRLQGNIDASKNFIADIGAAGTAVDALNAQIAESHDTIAVLREALGKGYTAVGRWFIQTALLAERTKLQFLEQQQGAEGYIEQLQRGGVATQGLIDLARAAAESYQLLDAQTLSRLEGEINRVAEAHRRLNEEADRAAIAAEDEADPDGAKARRLAREKIEYEEKYQEAVNAGLFRAAEKFKAAAERKEIEHQKELKRIKALKQAQIAADKEVDENRRALDKPGIEPPLQTLPGVVPPGARPGPGGGSGEPPLQTLPGIVPPGAAPAPGIKPPYQTLPLVVQPAAAETGPSLEQVLERQGLQFKERADADRQAMETVFAQQVNVLKEQAEADRTATAEAIAGALIPLRQVVEAGEARTQSALQLLHAAVQRPVVLDGDEVEQKISGRVLLAEARRR